MQAREDHPLYGDVLDVVVSRCSTLDLHPASHVSKAWRTAVLSSLCRSPRSAPWLFLHLHDPARAATTTAFDPLTRRWQSKTPVPMSNPASQQKPCRSPPPPPPTRASYNCYSYCGGTRLCALSNSKLALSSDAFGMSWRELEAPPQACRTIEPVVAVVGSHVVVAGQAGRAKLFEDEETSVVVRSDNSGGCGARWEPCEHTPEALVRWRWSASTTSVAVSERRMFVLEKQAPGLLSWFEPATKRWGPARQLCLPAVFLSALGFIDGRLVVLGVLGGGLGSKPESVRLWAVDAETLEVDEEEMGRMPVEMVEALVEEGSDWGLWSIGFLCSEEFGYIYNPSYPKELVVCEFTKDRKTKGGRGGGGSCRWERVRQPALTNERRMQQGPAVYTCSTVETDRRWK